MCYAKRVSRTATVCGLLPVLRAAPLRYGSSNEHSAEVGCAGTHTVAHQTPHSQLEATSTQPLPASRSTVPAPVAASRPVMSHSASRPSNPAKHGHASSSSGSPTSSSSASTTIPRLPPHIEEMRRKVFIEPQSATNTAAILSPDAFSAYGVSTQLTVDVFSRSFSIDVTQLSKDRIVFDMIGCEAPLANALRRILLAEVPTMAIEKCVIFQNTSIIQDEVLAHRLGLLPLKADPTIFTHLADSNYVANELNTLVFTLDVTCSRTANTSETAVNEEKYTNSIITTADIKWQPQGRQAQRLTGDQAVGLYYDDIVVAKMRPGQSIQVEMHAEKGIGAQHAKWYQHTHTIPTPGLTVTLTAHPSAHSLFPAALSRTSVCNQVACRHCQLPHAA